ncbi:hypothetical protein ACIQWA_03675 [Kitasatospora sp. NPDC098652]|uniref:hypothetical protein n=1 Tax=Kitasatospora sp. NPDC098652 TaxID=3364095 RepID=UPI00382AE2A5
MSASASGSDTFAQVGLTTTSTATFKAILSKVHDCSSGGQYATPLSVEVTVTGGSSPLEPFTLPSSSSAARKICLTVTIGSESREIMAGGMIQGTGNTGETGNTGNTGNTDQSGAPTGGGTGASTGSTP